MPKQKSFHAGNILGVTEIHWVSMLVAVSVVPSCSVLWCVSQEILLYPGLGVYFSSSLFPPASVYLLLNYHTVFLAEIWSYTGLG